MVLYGIVVFVAACKPGEGRPASEIPIVLILGAVAAANGFAALGVHKLFAAPDRIVAWARAQGGGDRDTMARAAWERWRAMNIVAWALGESVVLFGVVAAFVKPDPLAIVPFMALGLVIHVLMFPRAAAMAAKLGS